MLLSTLLRDARRRHGLSIRAAAQRCDVPRTTWAGWESGQTSPTAQRLERALAAMSLDLQLAERRPEPPGEDLVRRHLRRSLTDRARTALGHQLDATLTACRDQPRLLTGPAAAGVWIPYVIARGPLPLPSPCEPGLVPLRLDADAGRRAVAFVRTPAVLLSGGAAASWPSLTTSARLLAVEAPRDAGERRLPAHRDPDEEREFEDLWSTLTWGGRGVAAVSACDSRAWRLSAAASLDEALIAKGLPPRHPPRRGVGWR